MSPMAAERALERPNDRVNERTHEPFDWQFIYDVLQEARSGRSRIGFPKRVKDFDAELPGGSTDVDVGEAVYKLRVSCALDGGDHLFIVLYTTLDTRTLRSRESGSDAIRHVYMLAPAAGGQARYAQPRLWTVNDGTVVTGRAPATRTNRTSRNAVGRRLLDRVLAMAGYYYVSGFPRQLTDHQLRSYLATLRWTGIRGDASGRAAPPAPDVSAEPAAPSE
jgi:hypothetical protein